MNRWKLVVPVVSLVAAFAVVGCASAPPPPPAGPAPAGPAPAEAEGPPAEVVVQAAPPPVQVEVVPAAPAGDYVWVKGHWHWSAAQGQYVWVHGHHAVRRAGWHWVEASYVQRGGGFVYVGPHWAR